MSALKHHACRRLVDLLTSGFWEPVKRTSCASSSLRSHGQPNNDVVGIGFFLSASGNSVTCSSHSMLLGSDVVAFATKTHNIANSTPTALVHCYQTIALVCIAIGIRCNLKHFYAHPRVGRTSNEKCHDPIRSQFYGFRW